MISHPDPPNLAPYFTVVAHVGGYAPLLGKTGYDHAQPPLLFTLQIKCAVILARQSGAIVNIYGIIPGGQTPPRTRCRVLDTRLDDGCVLRVASDRSSRLRVTGN